jgi:DNA-directed RNA polymerase beta subunit
MGKQTMGVPVHAFSHRTDNKLYRIQTPQKPLSRTDMQEQIPFNDYATGTNAIVAVLSYTGYDMEDAMIVNKSSYERGFAFANLFKTYPIDLREDFKEKFAQNSLQQQQGTIYLSNRLSELGNHDPKSAKIKYVEKLDLDGLP